MRRPRIFTKLKGKNSLSSDDPFRSPLEATHISPPPTPLPFLSSPFRQRSIHPPICSTALLLARLLRIARDNFNLVGLDGRILPLPLPSQELEGNILNQEGPDLVTKTVGIQVTLKTYTTVDEPGSD